MSLIFGRNIVTEDELRKRGADVIYAGRKMILVKMTDKYSKPFKTGKGFRLRYLSFINSAFAAVKKNTVLFIRDKEAASAEILNRKFCKNNFLLSN